MTITSRRVIGIALALIVVGALVVGVYAFRDRLRSREADHAAMTTASSGSPPAGGTGGASATVSRGDVSIDPQRQ